MGQAKRVSSGKVVNGKVVVRIGGIEYTGAELLEMKRTGRNAKLSDLVNGRPAVEIIEAPVAQAPVEEVAEPVVEEPRVQWASFSPSEVSKMTNLVRREEHKGLFARLKEVFGK